MRDDFIKAVGAKYGASVASKVAQHPHANRASSQQVGALAQVLADAQPAHPPPEAFNSRPVPLSFNADRRKAF